MLEVISTGPLATIQDLGRPGYAHLGVPRSGALDQPALRLANRLVANDDSAAGLELTFGDAVIRALTSTYLAVTGAPAPIAVDGRPAPFAAPLAMPQGATLRVGRPAHGVRSYIAVAGGIDVPAVLDSRSTDSLSGLGPTPLRAGDLLPMGTAAGFPAGADAMPVSGFGADIAVRVRFGPRADWFADRDQLLRGRYVVAEGNRIGVRLTGPPLARAVNAELPSEGLLVGAVQVPANGQPLIFLADHPTTGGYPVIAVVHPADLPLVAQARPGVTIRFAPA